MDPPSPPHLQITEPDDLALSSLSSGSRTSGSSANSLDRLRDLDALFTENDDSEKRHPRLEHHEQISARDQIRLLLWIIAHIIASVTLVMPPSLLP